MSPHEKSWVHLASSADRWDQDIFDRELSGQYRLTFGEQSPQSAAFQMLVAGRPDRMLLEASPQLDRLIIPWAGVPTETRRRLQDFPDLAVHNLHHNDQTTAELAMALLLAAARRVVTLDQALRDGDWRPRYDGPHGVELHGRRALILGYGRIGHNIAKLCLAFGMDVHATRRGAGKPGIQDGVHLHPASAMSDLLPDTQVLILCLPLTQDTEGIIGTSELMRLSAETILVNVGRGELVQQWPLYNALVEGRLLAAGIDVWYQYPDGVEDRQNTRPSEAPFWELDNVVMSPHRAGMVQSTTRQRTNALVELLKKLAAGDLDHNRVDLARGY